MPNPKKHETSGRLKIAPYVSDQRKRRKKIRRYLFIAAGILALGLISWGTVWIFKSSPLFRVEQIVVTGNNGVPSENVIALVQTESSSTHKFFSSMFGWGNMLKWPNEVPTQNLSMVPQVAKVTISKDYFSHTVTLNVTERAPFGIWCFLGTGEHVASVATSTSVSTSTNFTPTSSAVVVTSTTAASSTASEESAVNTGSGQCYWFDDTGVLFERSLSTQGNLIFMVNDYSQSPRELSQTVLPDQFNDNFISAVNVLREAGLSVKEIDLNDLSLEEIDARTVEGPQIKFSLRTKADNYLPVIKDIIKQGIFNKLQYVDCRTENRVFYK